MEMGIYAENPFWIKEKFLSYSIFEGTENGFLKFPFDFPFEFSGQKKGVATLNNDHYVEVDFKLTIYGPVVNPIIYIGDNPYKINTTVEENEYLVIDSEKNTVKRTLKKWNGCE